jgi:hypothetical protein
MANDTPPPAADDVWKVYLTAAIGAFFLGISDYIRHGSQSTVVELATALGSQQVWLFFLLTPVLGLLAAWINRPGTQRDAFALGFAVFSIFALVPPQQESKAITDKIGVSPPEIHTGLSVSASAFAQEAGTPTASANVVLQYEGSPPPETKVSVTNVTEGTDLGTFTIRDTVKLVGKPGDQIRLNFEAAGHQRTQVVVPLAALTRDYKVQLKETSTPLFLQRLVPAQMARPSSAP